MSVPHCCPTSLSLFLSRTPTADHRTQPCPGPACRSRPRPTALPCSDRSRGIATPRRPHPLASGRYRPGAISRSGGTPPTPALPLSLSALTCRVALPRRPSPTPPCRYKTRRLPPPPLFPTRPTFSRRSSHKHPSLPLFPTARVPAARALLTPPLPKLSPPRPPPSW
jgi:hypothetical protein